MRRDIDFNLTPHPMNGDLSTKAGESAIRQAVKNVVLTNFYERGFNIPFGSNVRLSLFENIGVLEVQTLKDQISEAVRMYETDIDVYEVYVERGSNENELKGSIIYTEDYNPEKKVINIDLFRTR